MSAGRRVSAPSTETVTTTMAPVAMERSVAESTRNSPARETTTVAPEKATATPDVRSATARASSGDRPPASSSR
jgi:hypothetical protein